MSFFPRAVRWCLLSKTEFSYIAIGLFISLKILVHHHVIVATPKALSSLLKSQFVKCHSLLLTGFGFSSRGTADGSTLSLLWNILKRFQEDQRELYIFEPWNFPHAIGTLLFRAPRRWQPSLRLTLRFTLQTDLATSQYFYEVLLIPLYNEVLVKCVHSNESHWAVLSCGAVYYTVQGGSKFWVSGWNPHVWPFQMKAILRSTFL